MTIGIGVLATIGIIFCGYIIMTARDNAEQITKAKRRLLEIVIGIVLWALFTVILWLFVPSADSVTGDIVSNIIQHMK